MVEPVPADVCRGDQAATNSSSVIVAVAMARGRGVGLDQRRDALPWRAVDHDGEAREVFVTKHRDRAASGMRSLAQCPGRELTSAVAMSGSSNGAV